MGFWSGEKIPWEGRGWVEGGCSRGTSLAPSPGRDPRLCGAVPEGFDLLSEPLERAGAVLSLLSSALWSLFLPGSCSEARPESLTSVCWVPANLLSRLVSLVSAKFRLLWTYRG